METFVFDANVPIAFDTAGHFSVLSEIFVNPQEHKIMMSKDNFDECKRKYSFKLCNQLKAIPSFNVNETLDKNKVKEIKKVCEKKLGQKLHQGKKDEDYQVIALAIQENTDFLVTNDRKLFDVFENYKKSFPNDPIVKKIKPMTIALFLRYMGNLNRDILIPKRFASVNFDVYEKVETPNFWEGIKNYTWELELVQNLFKPYAQNVMEVIK